MLRRSQSPRFFVGIGGQRRGTTKLAVRGLARQFAVRPATAPGLIRHLMGLRRHDDYHSICPATHGSSTPGSRLAERTAFR